MIFYSSSVGIDKSNLKNRLCLSLIKIWHIKPKQQLFMMLPKAYHLIHQRLRSNSLSLTLIAELSYDRNLLPSYQMISKLLQENNIMAVSEMRFFRTLQILKNFISNVKEHNNNQFHPRQLVFEYLNWIKSQVNLLLAENSNLQYI